MKKLIISNLFLLTLSIQCMQASELKDDKIVYQPKSLVELCLAIKNQDGRSLSEQVVETICTNIKNNRPFDDGIRNEILGNFKIAIHLKPFLNKRRVLIDAVSSYDDQVVEWLLQTGADVNARNIFGQIPLHYAQTAEQTKQLLVAGADVNARNDNGQTPLHYAQTAEQTKQLLAAGADVHARDHKGWTPLHYAKTVEKAKLLLAAGADVNARNIFDQTPLYKAKTVVQTALLLAAGANVNARDDEGWTPLHMAKTAAKTELLLAAGADVNARDNDGYTPLHVYCSCRGRGFISWEQIKLIIFAGADENAKDGLNSRIPVEGLPSTSSKHLIDIKKFNKIIEKRNAQRDVQPDTCSRMKRSVIS
ncbi:MAG: ankyrin repeat domain-containing protein [Candidatus Chromulinivorax sp.]